MFKVGDIVKYITEVQSTTEWIGIVVEKGHNGHNEWLKVKYFNDDLKSERISSSSKFILVS